MVDISTINGFLSQRSLALIGISRSGKKFGNVIFKELKSKGYQIFPINSNAERIQDDFCYPSLKVLHEKVGGVIVVLPPAQTEIVVREIAAAGIERIWMQQGSESPAAVKFCEDNGLNFVHGECIMMFTAKTSFPHNVHHWVNGVVGKLPK